MYFLNLNLRRQNKISRIVGLCDAFFYKKEKNVRGGVIMREVVIIYLSLQQHEREREERKENIVQNVSLKNFQFKANVHVWFLDGDVFFKFQTFRICVTDDDGKFEFSLCIPVTVTLGDRHNVIKFLRFLQSDYVNFPFRPTFQEVSSLSRMVQDRL